MFFFKKKSGLVLFLIFMFVFFGFESASAQGIVPCGGIGESPCKLCHLIVGIDNIIDWIRNVTVGISLTMVVVGGIMYMVAAGNQQMIDQAKTVVKQSLIGVVFVLASWMIINSIFVWMSVKPDFGVGVTNWSEFNCSIE